MIRLCVLAFAFAAAADEPPPFYAGNEELRAYLMEAAEQHPALYRQHAEWRAALARIPQVTSLEDPMFMYEQFIQSDFRMSVQISQSFPWFGTLKRRGDMAAREAEARFQQMYDLRNRIFAAVKRAYYEYAYLGDQIELMRAQIEILVYMEEIARTKYSLGMASQDEVLRTQIELERVRDETSGMLQMRPALAAELNEALGRPIHAEIPWPQASALPPAPPAAPFVEAWIAESNPQLNALDEEAAARDAEIALARLQGRPGFTIGVEYEYMDIDRPSRAEQRPSRTSTGGGDGMETDGGAGTAAPMPESGEDEDEDTWMVSVAMNVPIYRKKIRAGIEEARHRKAAVEYEQRDMRQTLEASARMALFQIADAQRRYATFTDNIVPKAEQSYSSIQSAYASGGTEVSFLDVFASIGDLLSFELEKIRALRDWQVAVGELEYLMGGSWIGVEGAGAMGHIIEETDTTEGGTVLEVDALPEVEEAAPANADPPEPQPSP